jgi:DNA-binding NtrC family response regulator
MVSERILLVDDEVEFIEALSERLETRGVKVETATSGAEAIEKVKSKKFDVIVLDLAMQGMDGIETLNVLHQDYPELQVILLTGHATVEKSVEAMKLGAMDFLQKPVQIGDLMAKIREAKTIKDSASGQKTKKIIDDILLTKGW